MATVKLSKKACSVNPLKMSQPIGGALAFMGLRGAMPLAAWLARLHILWTGVVHAAFQGKHSDADDRDERGRDRARRL